MFLAHMSIFVQIRCYLLFDQLTYALCIILDYENLKFKHLIDDIAIDIWSSWNFASLEDNIRTFNSTITFLKFISKKRYKKSLKDFSPNLSQQGIVHCSCDDTSHSLILKT